LHTLIVIFSNMKYKTILFTLSIALTTNHFKAQVGMGTSNPDPSSILDVVSTNKGVLIPRMSTTERNAIVSPAEGLLVYDNVLKGFYGFNGTAWTQDVFSSVKWSLSGNSGTNPLTHFLGTIDAQPLVFRTSNAIAMTAAATGEITMAGRDITAPRLLVTRPQAGSPYPAILATVENDNTSSYPVNIMVANASTTGRVKGTYAFAANSTTASAGTSLAGISYVDIVGQNWDLPGIVFYTGSPATQDDFSKDVLFIGNNGNVYMGYQSSQTSYPSAKVNVANGDVYLSTAGRGIVMKSPNGNCWRTTVSSTGSLQTQSTVCP